MKSADLGLGAPPFPAGLPARAAHDMSHTTTDHALVLSLDPAGPNAVVLRCQGEIIFRTEARALSSLLTEVLPMARHLVVDLAGVTALDSNALGELVVTQMWADAAGYDLKFVTPMNSVWRILETTNLVAVLDVYSTVAGALAALHSEPIHPS